MTRYLILDQIVKNLKLNRNFYCLLDFILFFQASEPDGDRNFLIDEIEPITNRAQTYVKVAPIKGILALHIEETTSSANFFLAAKCLRNVNEKFELIRNHGGDSNNQSYSMMRRELINGAENFLKALKSQGPFSNEIASQRERQLINFEQRRKQIYNKLKSSSKQRKISRAATNIKMFNYFQFSKRKSFVRKAHIKLRTHKIKAKQSETSQSYDSYSGSSESDQRLNETSDKKENAKSIDSDPVKGDLICQTDGKISKSTEMQSIEHEQAENQYKIPELLNPKKNEKPVNSNIFEKVSQESQICGGRRQVSTLRLIEIFSTENEILKPEYKQGEVEYDPNEKLIQGYSRVIKGKLQLPRRWLDVAIKIPDMPESNEDRIQLHRSLINEIKITRKLVHKNVVRFVGTMRLDNDCACLLTEWHEGCDLNYFYSRPIDVRDYYMKTTMFDLADILTQAARGFVFIHQMNVIHRDFKSPNVSKLVN
jgi:hypothetical protein